jgi:hypothetical protein
LLKVLASYGSVLALGNNAFVINLLKIEHYNAFSILSHNLRRSANAESDKLCFDRNSSIKFIASSLDILEFLYNSTTFFAAFSLKPKD